MSIYLKTKIEKRISQLKITPIYLTPISQLLLSLQYQNFRIPFNLQPIKSLPSRQFLTPRQQKLIPDGPTLDYTFFFFLPQSACVEIKMSEILSPSLLNHDEDERTSAANGGNGRSATPIVLLNQEEDERTSAAAGQRRCQRRKWKNLYLQASCFLTCFVASASS